MGEKVDVLAVMDTEIQRAGGDAYQAGRDLIAARAAVAELIEAADEASVALGESTGSFDQLAAHMRLCAALARIGAA